MRNIRDFPNEIREVENEFIPMPDGINLASRLWIPKYALSQPVPAILEYIPYRKRDMKRIVDEKHHRYFAGNGFAGVRVDIRGSGESDGLLTDEYLEQELLDGERIIEWIAAQPWCDGNVGMIGISWGGFNGLQLAARRPEALKAIITVCSTDDRYADDVHYMGGCLLGDNLSWASVMFDRNSTPPDPLIVGDKWREMWMDRLEHSGLWVKQWLEHQRRDDYWKHGSVCENYEDIQCPVMAVSGWADGYSNAVFRLLKHLKVPRMGLVGPWSHRYPHMGEPGPAIGFLQECVRWWDQWLKKRETGINQEPMLKAWVQESVHPYTGYEERPGYWLGLKDWPSEMVQNEKYYLYNDHMLKGSRSEKHKPKGLSVQSPLNLGMFAGKWCSYSAPPDLPGDQRDEDGGALVFTSPQLDRDLHIIGGPEVDLELEVDRPVAMIAVRLSDVGPDDKATRVTYGLLNLCHRNSHEHPEKMQPGEKYRIKVRMNEVGQIFPKGHKIRLSISTSYFPLAWTPPELVRMKVYGETSSLQLPVLIDKSDEKVQFGMPEAAVNSSQKETLQAPQYRWDVKRNLITNEACMDVLKNEGKYYLKDIDLELDQSIRETYSLEKDSLETVKAETFTQKKMKRGKWNILTKTHTVLTSDELYFYLHATLDAYENYERVFSKIWSEKIRRDHV